MSYKTLLAIPVSALVLGVGASAAAAVPSGTLKGAGATDNLVYKAHGCHRSCEWGPVLRWHRHGAGCHPIACFPRAVHPHRCWVDAWGVHRCRW